MSSSKKENLKQAAKMIEMFSDYMCHYEEMSKEHTAISKQPRSRFIFQSETGHANFVKNHEAQAAKEAQKAAEQKAKILKQLVIIGSILKQK